MTTSNILRILSNIFAYDAVQIALSSTAPTFDSFKIRCGKNTSVL
jgi:hypothetical protein